jgi:hypothetical protein
VIVDPFHGVFLANGNGNLGDRGCLDMTDEVRDFSSKYVI